MAKLKAGPDVYRGMKIGDQVFKGEVEVTGPKVLALENKTVVKTDDGGLLFTWMDTVTGEKWGMQLSEKEVAATTEWLAVSVVAPNLCTAEGEIPVEEKKSKAS